MSRHRKKSNNLGVVALLLVGVAGASGVVYYVKNAPKAIADPPSVDASVTRHPVRDRTVQEPKADTSVTDSKEVSQVVVFEPYMDGGALKFHESKRDVAGSEKPIVVAVNGFLRASHIAPADARAIGVDIKDGVALIDFNEGFRQTYGSTDEKTMLEGMSRAMGQFPDVKKFQMLIDGKPIDTLGNVELSEPLDVIKG